MFESKNIALDPPIRKLKVINYVCYSSDHHHCPHTCFISSTGLNAAI